jgi:hypothetical protein
MEKQQEERLAKKGELTLKSRLLHQLLGKVLINSFLEAKLLALALAKTAKLIVRL